MCVTGNNNEQSPINIVKSQVALQNNLDELHLYQWNVCLDGTLENNGHTLVFTPNNIGKASTRIFLTRFYDLQQFHMHWGKFDGEGSEHLIDGQASELEIHFVHTKQGGTAADRDYYAVVSLLAEVDYANECGPWTQLDPSGLVNKGSSVPVSNYRLDELLPCNLDYYHYEGSLTTPPCSENVLWFVLKSKIQVPASYLESLRKLKGTQGDEIKSNFRSTQDIGGRSVKSPLCENSGKF